MIVEQNDLRDRRLETLGRIFQFLGVDPKFEHPAFESLRQVTSRKRRQSRLGIYAQRVRPGASLDLNRIPPRAGSGRSRPGGVSGKLPRFLWSPLDKGVKVWGKAKRRIGRPDMEEILDPEVISVLGEDAERLKEFTRPRLRALDDLGLSRKEH